MGNQDEQLSVDQPAIYRIVIQGRLSPAWSTRFDDMSISVEDGNVQPIRTVLTGRVADQAALYGLLYESLAAEQHQRLAHMEHAIDRLDQTLAQLAIERNALRQEKIVEEIEVILSSEQAFASVTHA